MSKKPSTHSPGEHFELIAAAFTPMKASGELNTASIPKYFHWLQSEGLDGIFVCGSTGECPSLTVGERIKISEAWLTARGAARKFRIFIHVGHDCLSESRTLAKHAADIGADAISSIAPSGFTPRTIDETLAHAAEVAAAAPRLPFYFYYIPSKTKVTLPMTQFVEAATARIPNFAGVKFTHEDLGEFAECLAVAGTQVQMLYGRDELLLPALAAGANAAIGSTYNFAAPLFRKIIASFRNHNDALAREEYLRARKMIRAVVARGPLAGQKAAMNLLGLDCGPTRLPLKKADSTEIRQLRSTLDSLGFHFRS